MSKFILPFSKISAKDIKIAGGKGASLGEMAGAKIPVPNGFVILAGAFDYFLNLDSHKETVEVGLEIKAELSKVNFNDVNSIDRASNVIRDIIDDTKIPRDLINEIKTEFKKLKAKSVAVRSSATAEDSKVASWAGELETYLNTTEKAFLKNIKKCWSSLYTPRAIFYRYEKNLIDQKVSVAVVVQKMIQSEISGVCFTVHPVTKDENQMIIETGYGLGEAIVSGQITPDSYVVSKSKVRRDTKFCVPRRDEAMPRLYNEEFNILDINIAEQEKMLVRKNSTQHGIVWKSVSKTKQERQKLTNKQIIELAKICCQIERHYGFPCDIEWAFEKGKFYITQSRPITTLSDKIQEKKDSLILLGVWNVLPLEAWKWFDTIAIKHLQKLTGIKIRVFTYIEEELHYQCVFEREANKLRKKFEQIKTEEEQVGYISTIYDDFWKEISKLENYLKKIKRGNFCKFSNNEIVAVIQNFVNLWTAITMQICYSVFLDIWYPSSREHKIIKEIVAKARDYMGHFRERSNTIERKLYMEVATRLAIGVKDIYYLSPFEIIDALFNGTSYIQEIEKRKQFCVTTSIEGKYKIYSGEKAKMFFRQYQPPSVGTESKRELQGTSARKGYVTGAVRVIQRDKDFDKFKDGEILVVLQTMIHYLPIMKKAKAILTEFGGLTSHAAIVSRELNKPCIVGISNLLASVQDGDKVEVDADSGNIRVLNK